MKRTLAIVLFFVTLCISAVGQNNISKTAGVNYTAGPPTYTPSQVTASEYAIDTTNGYFWQWHRTGGGTGTWLRVGQGIDVIVGSVPPAYTPVRNMSHFAINAIDSLYRWSGSGTAWDCLNCPSGGAGTVISFAAGDLVPIFTTTVTDPTTTPTLDFILTNQNANTHLSGPVSGGAAAPTFRALVLADILGLNTANNGLSDNEAGGGIFRLGNRYMNLSDGLFGTDRKVNVNDNTLFFGDNSDSTLLAVFGATGRVGIRTTAASRALHVNGEVRITDLATTTATLVVGADGNGDLQEISLGSGLSLVGNVLSSTAGAFYQLLRDDGADETQRNATNFITSTWLSAVLTDDAVNNETEVTFNVIANSISNTELRQSVARSVVGRASNTTGNVADIQSGGADLPLVTNAGNTAILFQQLTTGGIANDAVTYAKLQNVAANNVFLGNDSGVNQNAQELTIAEAYVMLGMTGVDTRIAVWKGANVLGNDAGLVFDYNNDRQTITCDLPGSGAGLAALNITNVGTDASGEFLQMRGNMSANMSAGMYNVNNTGSLGNAIWVMSVGGATGGDAFFQFNVNGVVTHSFGVDNSDGDKVKLTMNGATPGANANDGFTWSNTSPPRYGINIATPLHPLDVVGVGRATQWRNTGNDYTAANLVFDTGAGTGPTLHTIAGGNNWVEIDFTTGTAPTNNGNIFTVTYPNQYTTNSIVVPGANDPDAANAIGNALVYMSTTNTTTFTMTANGTLPASTRMFFSFSMGGY